MRNLLKYDKLPQNVVLAVMLKGLGKLKKYCLTDVEIKLYINNPDNYASLRKADTATLFLYEIADEIFCLMVHPLPHAPNELHKHTRDVDDKLDTTHLHRTFTLITPIDIK